MTKSKFKERLAWCLMQNDEIYRYANFTMAVFATRNQARAEAAWQSKFDDEEYKVVKVRIVREGRKGR